MNWIIEKSDKLRYHTDLLNLFKVFDNDIDNYQWIISDFEFNTLEAYPALPINYEKDFFVFEPKQFRRIIDADIQCCWGAILAIPLNSNVILNSENLPSAEAEFVFKEGYLQHPEAVLEIDCFDSGYTILKFRNKALSDKFISYFTEAIPLTKFNNQ